MAVDPAAIAAAVEAIETGIAARQSWAQVGRNAIRDLKGLGSLGGWQRQNLPQTLEQLKSGLALGMVGRAAVDTIIASLEEPKAAQSPQRDGRRPERRGRFY